MIANLAEYLNVNAQRFPDKSAVISGDRSITYRQLDRDVSCVAGYLRKKGVGTGDRIGILMPRSIPAVIAIFGVLRSGAAYVPMDMEMPESRNRYIIENCNLKFILTEGIATSTLSECATLNDLLIPVEICLESGIVSRDTLTIEVDDEDIVYILYTSGSTGVPKGVAVSRKAALAFLDWSFEEFKLKPTDNFAGFAAFNFDLSVFDLFNGIRSGGTLHLIPHTLCMLPKKLVRYIIKNNITVWYSVPWVLTSMVRFGRLDRISRLPLRLILFAGEIFPINDLKTLVSAIPIPVCYNLFGPTETNVCTAYRLPKSLESFQEPVPIGFPVSGNTAYVIDDNGEVITGDSPGELIIQGDSVMSGYWNESQMTDSAFLDYLPGVGPGRFYRTGDRVSQCIDGNLRYHGRLDSMIKRRGYRIEPGEIEHAACEHDSVSDAVVLPEESERGLILNLILSPDPGISPVEFKNFLSQKIALYMVPDDIVYLKILPRNSNGKIDRKKLKEELA